MGVAYTSFLFIVEESFEIKDRKCKISNEAFCGLLHYVSCLFILPVIPIQLEAAGYDISKSIQTTSAVSAFGCIISSYLTNLPFVIAPPSSVSIYIAVALQQNRMNQSQGDTAVILSGVVLLFIGVCPPLMVLAAKLIPNCVQASTAVGIGLITALAGATELQLVVRGNYAILEMGSITPGIIIAFFATVLIAVALHYHKRIAYISGLLFGTISWWIYGNCWPRILFEMPSFDISDHLQIDQSVILLLLNLSFLYIITLSGIARSMSDLGRLTRADGTIPRGNWLFIICGISTIISGYFSGPPILISPESTPGIKAGSRTGLSTLICGLLFVPSTFFCPLFESIPPSGTSPLLLLVGMTLFVNSGRIAWTAPSEAIPAFFVLFLIPFTYSILAGVIVGYLLYLAIRLFTGELFSNCENYCYTNDYRIVRAAVGATTTAATTTLVPPPATSVRGQLNPLTPEALEQAQNDRDKSDSIATAAAADAAAASLPLRQLHDAQSSNSISTISSNQSRRHHRRRGGGGGGGGGGASSTAKYNLPRRTTGSSIHGHNSPNQWRSHRNQEQQNTNPIPPLPISTPNRQCLPQDAAASSGISDGDDDGSSKSSDSDSSNTGPSRHSGDHGIDIGIAESHHIDTGSGPFSPSLGGGSIHTAASHAGSAATWNTTGTNTCNSTTTQRRRGSFTDHIPMDLRTKGIHPLHSYNA